MIFSEKLLEIFKLHVKLQERIGTSPFTHSVEKPMKEFSNYFLRPNSAKSMRWQKIKIYQFLVFTVLIWFQTLYGKSGRSPLITMECMLYCTTSCAFILTKWVSIQRCPMIVETFNLLLQFEKRHLKGIFLFKHFNI